MIFFSRCLTRAWGSSFISMASLSWLGPRSGPCSTKSTWSCIYPAFAINWQKSSPWPLQQIQRDPLSVVRTLHTTLQCRRPCSVGWVSRMTAVGGYLQPVRFGVMGWCWSQQGCCLSGSTHCAHKKPSICGWCPSENYAPIGDCGLLAILSAFLPSKVCLTSTLQH